MARPDDVQLPTVWRGAALDRTQETNDICLGVCMTVNLVKQAAPVNVSTRGLSAPSADQESPSTTIRQNIACGSFREPPVQHRIWTSSHQNENARDLGARAKAAPLQALGADTFGQRHNAVEDKGDFPPFSA